MRILVTGATGFLGSYLVQDLVEHRHEVAVLLRPGSDTWRLRELMPRVRQIMGSLDESDQLEMSFAAFEPEGVVHMAWGGVGNNDRNSPGQARNIPSTLELAALSAKLGARTFVGAGSQAEYGPYSRAIREDDAAHPTTLYGKAKLAAGDMAAQVAAARGMRFAWLRIFSTYGPKDADHWLIPSMIKTLREGRRMSLSGCEQLWGFLHAHDAASAFRIVIESEAARGIYNVGALDAPALRETVMVLRDMVDPAAELGFGEVPYRADQVMILKADVDRLLALGWTPQIPLQLGLRATVDWYDAVEHA